MKSRIFKLIFTFALFVLIFAVQKPLFMVCHSALYADATAADRLEVVRHGLPLDLSIAGYLTVVPGLLLAASVWLRRGALRMAFRVYFALVAMPC